MKTSKNRCSVITEKSGIMKISKDVGNGVIKYVAVGVLALLALGIFTSSQEINAA